MRFSAAGERRSGWYSVCIASMSNDQSNLIRAAEPLAGSEYLSQSTQPASALKPAS